MQQVKQLFDCCKLTLYMYKYFNILVLSLIILVVCFLLQHVLLRAVLAESQTGLQQRMEEEERRGEKDKIGDEPISDTGSEVD